MNDITYRPFIRDSALGDINIQIPNLEIPVYKPRYSQPLEDDTETEVQSQVEEIRNPEPIVQETTVHKFNSKKDFKDTMLPIYERLLKSKGLNPAFAKSLVAQDGLESAWGSKPAGLYNFGGIKGKGTTKRTREVINGKDVYINDQFRNFKSLEDYANFKIDLLNNKRYKAFSGDIKEFANRVHRGGYATDPRYANILNQVIASAKHGGVLKFQQGGIQEGKQWLEDWYKSRKGLVKQNVKQVLPIPLPVTESLVFNALKRNLDLTRAKINPSKVPDNASGVYYPFGRRIFLTDGSTSTAIHEWTHSSLPDAQEKVIKKYQDNFGDTVYDNKTIAPDEYLDNPQEIYARLMQLRYSINADPNHKFTKEEIQNIKKEHLDHYTLTNRLKNSEGKGSFSVSQFDKDGKIIQSEPFNPEYKIVPEESTVTPHCFQNSIQVTDNERKPNLSYPVNTEYGDYIPNSNYPNLDYYHKFGQTDNKFKELAEILKPIFVQVLKEKNLPLTQVDNLVRQAALESQYGLDPRGSRGFNLGGIKWNNNQTDREWTKHKDGEKYIDFENLYDYAQYKVDLLNSRYNALTATSTNDFVDRLHGNNDTNSNYSQGKDNYIRTLNRTTSLNKYLSNNGQ